MQCDICGATKGEFTKAIIEGSILQVCSRCTRFGAVIETHSKTDEAELEKKSLIKDAGKGFHFIDPAENITQEFPSLIKNAREKRKLSHEELANAVAERESVIQKIESGSLTPPVKISRKLEQYLGIKLITQQKSIPAIQKTEAQEKINIKDQKLTIGDLLRLKFNANKK